MHIGAVLVFEARPRPTTSSSSTSRRAASPRFRQKLVFPPLRERRRVGGRPAAEPRVPRAPLLAAGPGRRRPARDADGEAFPQQLDRSKPPGMVSQGLEDNRFALISKTHHALVDGVSGVDLGTVLFDANPVPAGLTPPQRPEPQPEPSEGTGGAWRRERRADAGADRRLVEAGASAAGRQRRTRPGAEGIGEIAWDAEPGARRPPTRRSARTAGTSGSIRTWTTSRS